MTLAWRCRELLALYDSSSLEKWGCSTWHRRLLSITSKVYSIKWHAFQWFCFFSCTSYWFFQISLKFRVFSVTNKDHSIITKFLKHKSHTYFICTYILSILWYNSSHFKCLEAVFQCKLVSLSSFAGMARAWLLRSIWLILKWDGWWLVGTYSFTWIGSFGSHLDV